MNIFSWNVNGIRAVKKKGFFDFLSEYDPDILCLQETKAHVEQLGDDLINIPGYKSFFDSPKYKKGYSGVAIYTKEEPIKVSTSLKSDKDLDDEGRTLIAEYNDFILLNFYFPNGQMNEDRLQYKLRFHEAAYRLFLSLRRKKKNLIGESPR